MQRNASEPSFPLISCIDSVWNATVVTRCYHKVPEWARTPGPRMATARRDSPHRGRLPPPNALSPRWATATRGAVRRNKVRSPLGHLWQRLPRQSCTCIRCMLLALSVACLADQLIRCARSARQTARQNAAEHAHPNRGESHPC